MLKLYDCDVGLTIRGQAYEFTHVNSITVEDPQKTKLIRGANAKNKIGLAFTEGIKESATVTTSVMQIPAALHGLLRDVFAKKERMDFWAISRKDGSSKQAKNCILSQDPQQLTLDENPDSMNTVLVLESFDVADFLKGDE